MEVVFDPHKDAINVRFHGISLARASEFAFDTAVLDIDDSQDYGETRYIAIGWLSAGLWTLVFSLQNEVVRPISLRKSTSGERRIYAQTE